MGGWWGPLLQTAPDEIVHRVQLLRVWEPWAMACWAKHRNLKRMLTAVMQAMSRPRTGGVLLRFLFLLIIFSQNPLQLRSQKAVVDLDPCANSQSYWRTVVRPAKCFFYSPSHIILQNNFQVIIGFDNVTTKSSPRMSFQSTHPRRYIWSLSVDIVLQQFFGRRQKLLMILMAVRDLIVSFSPKRRANKSFEFPILLLYTATLRISSRKSP